MSFFNKKIKAWKKKKEARKEEEEARKEEEEARKEKEQEARKKESEEWLNLSPEENKRLEVFEKMGKAERRPGICLLINNAPNLEVQEKKLKDLFEFLSFNVKIERHVSKTEFFNLADQFAKKNFTHFDAFVVILMSVSGKLTKISCAEGRNISIEDVMQEFNASRFRSLRGKPKLFFVQCFKKPYSRVNPTGRVLRGTDTVSCPCFCTSEEDSCPKEADFLLICVKSTNPESLFIQIFDQVVRSSYREYHLLDMLIMVNKEMKVRQMDLPNIEVPHRTQTLRGRLYLDSRQLYLDPITPAVVQQDRYDMDKNPRGLCLILNNVKFNNKDLNRPGAVRDKDRLQSLFNNLLFEVTIKEDLTSRELVDAAIEFGAKDHGKYNAFVFIVMSHGGDGDCILGVDGRETTVKNLMSEFHGGRCPSLKDKPKVFIIQACRGPQVDTNFTKSSSGNDFNLQEVPTTSQAQISSQPYDTALSTDSTLSRSVFLPDADFVVAFATAPGYAAYRDSDKGSRFIQALVEVINEHGNHLHFLEILTEVTRQVVDCFKSVQVPAPSDTLTKFLYLRE